MISLNDKVSLTDGNKAIVKYIGCIDGKKGTFYGIDLLNKKGKNNGTVNNISYFKSNTTKSGKFVKKSKINQNKIQKQPNSTKFSIDCQLVINGTKGTIKYIGIPNKKYNKTKDSYYGIELIKSKGNTDGKFINTKISYFKCDKNKGIYVKVIDIDNQTKNNTKQQKRIKKNKASRSSTITISKSIKLKERNKDEINDIVNTLPEYIKKQWNEHYNDIIDIKYKPKFIDILLHLNMIQFHMSDESNKSNTEYDEKKNENTIVDMADKIKLFKESLTFLLLKLKQLCEDVNYDNNRILYLNDENVIKLCLNKKLEGMVVLMYYFGWDKMEDMFVFFCDGVDSQINIIENDGGGKKKKKDKKKRNVLFIENGISFLKKCIEVMDDSNEKIQITKESELDNETELKMETIEDITTQNNDTLNTGNNDTEQKIDVDNHTVNDTIESGMNGANNDTEDTINVIETDNIKNNLAEYTEESYTNDNIINDMEQETNKEIIQNNDMEEDKNDLDNEEKHDVTYINNIDVPDYSLSIVEKLFEKKVRKNEEKESYNTKSFESEIPIYASKCILYETLNIIIYKYDWESFPDHKYKYLMLRAETNQFVRYLITCSFGNVLPENIKLASDKDEIIMTELKKSNKSKNADKNTRRIELKIKFKPYQKRDLLFAKVLADDYNWSWIIQRRNTSKKDNNIYLKLAEKLLSKIKRNYDEIYKQNNLNETLNMDELSNKLFHELKVPFFMDMNFLPFNESILSLPTVEEKKDDENPNEHASKNLYAKCFETSLFKRVIDMKLSSDYESHLFSPDNKLSFRNIEQGNLPNCGFVAALTSVAHKKSSLIEKCIFNIDDKINEYGLYKVNLYFNGILTEYILDDFIPCYCYGHKEPSFTKHITNIIPNTPNKKKYKKRNKSNIIWVLLLEKCLAKMYGGYDRLCNMYSMDAFSILTGYPSIEIDYMTINNSDKHTIIWNKLLKFGNNKNILLTSSCHPKRGNKSINDLFGSTWKRKNEFYGMFANDDGHVWSIIRVVEDKNIKLICLRNPWGETLEDSSAGNGLPGDRWKGKYSRYDTTSWNKQLLKQIKPNLKLNDGTFWVSFNDYINYFYNLTICYCFNNDYYRLQTKCNIKYCVSNDDGQINQSVLFPKIMIDIQLNDEIDEKGGENNKELMLKWVGIIQQDTINKNNNVNYNEYLDTCLFIGKLDENDNIKPLKLTNISLRRINYGTQSLNIKLKPNNKYVLIPYTTGHEFCNGLNDNNRDLTRNITITSFISGNKNNKYNIQMINDNNNFVNLKQMYNLFSNYIKISNDFKKPKKNDGDFVFTDNKYDGMIIAAWYHEKDNFKFKSKIKFKLDNCVPAIGFDYNNYLMKNKDKFFGNQDNKGTKKSKKYSWNFNVNNYVSKQVGVFIIKKIKNEISQFGYSYSFDNGRFEPC